MAKNYLKEFVTELEKGDNGRPYDYICQNAHSMSKETLANIIKECLCLDDSLNNPTVSQTDVYTAIADNIREWREDDLNDESEDM